MFKTASISLMTRYSIKKILRKYKEHIIVNQENLDINDINSIDFAHLIFVLYPDTAQQVTCIEQIEMLTTMCQIYSKQQQHEQLRQVERKIIYLLGYEIQE